MSYVNNIITKFEEDFEMNGKIFTAHFTLKSHAEETDPSASFDATEHADVIEAIQNGEMNWAIAEMFCLVSIKGIPITEASDLLGCIAYNTQEELLSAVAEHSMKDNALSCAKLNLSKILQVLS